MKTFLLVCFLFMCCFLKGDNKNFIIDDSDKTYVTDIYYDKELKMIVLQAHGQFLFFKIDEWFAVKTKDDVDVGKKLDELFDKKIKVYHLKKVK